MISLLFLSHANAQTCDGPAARVVSLQGTVEVRREQQAAWQPVQLEQAICQGDSLRVLALGRAALALPDETVTRLDQNTTITFRRPAASGAERTWLYILEGIIHVITRERDALRIETPFANAGIEGTEFLVTVTATAATVEVLEGAVGVVNAAGQRETAALDRKVTASAAATLTTAAADRASFRQGVRWTLYYPPVAPAAAGAQAARVARARDALVVGRAPEARAELDAVLAADPANADALALRSVMFLTQGDLPAARADAEAAVAAQPRSAAALLARSYVEQAEFKLDAAIATLQDAAAAEPANMLVQARLAELWLAVGETDRAVAAAQAAVASDGTLALPRTVLGFALLARVDMAGAAARFREAIERNSAAPLPRLGLGLALIRDGKLAEGREQIEIAVLLDPGNALIRSYLGKAYYEEKRDGLSATQLELAQEFDPADPTGFYYDAIRKQTVNRPVEALADLQASIGKNDNRAVYRSRLLLDQDLAARSASVGRVYRDLGFEELALREGWKSVATDPGDYSGHRLLADSYSSLPRHEIARVNELLQSQLLQPLNMTPVQPQLGQANLFILDTTGPSAVAFNEFNPLFSRDGLAVQGSAVTGTNDTFGADAVLAGIAGRWAFSVGGYHFETDGFHPNGDSDDDVGNVLVQYQPSASTTLLAEFRDSDHDEGDLVVRFNPVVFQSRLEDQSTTLRLGARHDFTRRSTGLVLVGVEDYDIELYGLESTFRQEIDIDIYTAEAQYAYQEERWDLTVGARWYGAANDERVNFNFPIPVPPFFQEFQIVDTSRTTNASVYSYGNWRVTEVLTLTAGFSFDDFEGVQFDRDEFNPKIGVVWEPVDGTTVRLGAFQTLQRPTPSRRDIQPSLEPTPVAGFNQFFFGSQAERGKRYGVGVDQRITARLFAGAEFSSRHLDLPFDVQLPPPDFGFQTITAEVDEQNARAYVYWTPDDRVAAGMSYEYDLFENDEIFAPYGFVTLETHRVPLSVSYFHETGFSAGLTGTYARQRGNFQDPTPPLFAQVRDEDDFWVVDAYLQYRLPNRWGVLRLEGRNLFDSDFQFQDVDPENPRIAPERVVLLKLTFAL